MKRRDRAVLVTATVVLVGVVALGVFLAFVAGVGPFSDPHVNPRFNPPAAKPADTMESQGGDCGTFDTSTVPKTSVVSEYSEGYKVGVIRGSVQCGDAEAAVRTAYGSAVDFGKDFPVSGGWLCSVVDPRGRSALPSQPITCRADAREVALTTANP